MKTSTRIVTDLEKQAYKFWKQGDYYVSCLLFHSLIEGALRDFLEVSSTENLSFYHLILKYEKFLSSLPYRLSKDSARKIIEPLIVFNKKRNRLVHELWKFGYGFANKKAKIMAQKVFLLYVLEVEYLGTFDDNFLKKWGIDYGTLGELEEWVNEYKF